MDRSFQDPDLDCRTYTTRNTVRVSFSGDGIRKPRRVWRSADRYCEGVSFYLSARNEDCSCDGLGAELNHSGLLVDKVDSRIDERFQWPPKRQPKAARGSADFGLLTSRLLQTHHTTPKIQVV